MEKVNHMLLNAFIVYQLGKGWYVNSAPIITADWIAEKGDKWIVPLGAGGGKVIMLGSKLPLNMQSQLYYNVVRPGNGPQWQRKLFFEKLYYKEELHAGTGLLFTDNRDSSNRLEIRPFQGYRLAWPNRPLIKIQHYVRVEERFDTNDFVFRIRVFHTLEPKNKDE